MWSTRWPQYSDLAGELNRLRGEMDRVFGPARAGNGTSRAGGVFPALNVQEDEDKLTVHSELPGVELDDLEIFVNGGDQLTIQGERKRPAVEGGTWHRQERGFGRFSRLVQLPGEVDAEKVIAQLRNGVLTIELPKREEAKPRRVEVKAGA